MQPWIARRQEICSEPRGFRGELRQGRASRANSAVFVAAAVPPKVHISQVFTRIQALASVRLG
jgi:hypothetical protein